MSQIIITTPRLILREWKEEDAVPFIKMNMDKEVMRFFPSTQTAEESMVLIARVKAHFADYGYGACAVERKDNGEFIGFTGLTHPRFESYFTPCVEIGWRLSKENWGHGFATEAATACLNHGFTSLGLEEIYSFTTTTNDPSMNVMKKIGMKHVGEFEHPGLPDGHILKTHVLYKITRNDVGL